LSACYKQLNSSVGQFGTSTLQADTAAIESTSAGDSTYTNTVATLAGLEQQRDQMAQSIKSELAGAEFGTGSIIDPRGQTQSCMALVAQAQALAGS